MPLETFGTRTSWREPNHVAEHASTAFETDNEHNAYQLSGQDSALTHIPEMSLRTRVASLAYDELRSEDRHCTICTIQNIL